MTIAASPHDIAHNAAGRDCFHRFASASRAVRSPQWTPGSTIDFTPNLQFKPNAMIKLRAGSFKHPQQKADGDSHPVRPLAKFRAGFFECLFQEAVVQHQSEVRIVRWNE